MTQSSDHPFQGGSSDRLSDRELDELLGLDPAPRLSRDAAARIHARLADADSAALDGLLALDEVVVPDGLAERIKRNVQPAAPARRLRLVPLVAAAFAAAAAVLLITRGGGALGDGSDAGPASSNTASARDPRFTAPSDELLAALPVLESMEFLTEELDPLEAEALFLFDEEDDVLFDLVSDAGLLEDDR